MPDPEILLWRYNFGPYMESRDKRFRLGNLYEWLTRQMRRVFRIFCKWKLQVNKYVPERLIISLLIMNQRQRASLFSVADPSLRAGGNSHVLLHRDGQERTLGTRLPSCRPVPWQPRPQGGFPRGKAPWERGCPVAGPYPCKQKNTSNYKPPPDKAPLQKHWNMFDLSWRFDA